MDIENLNRRIYRFLITIFKFLPKEAKPAFIQTSAKAFEVNYGQLLYRLNREVQVNGKAVDSSSLPHCVLADLKENTLSAKAERKKLEVVRQLVLDNEDPQYLLHLVDQPKIFYCRSCKLLEYDRNFYMSHNMKNDLGFYLCLSCYYVK